MARLKKPRAATLEEVHISRQGTSAIIEFRDPAWATTHLALGHDTAQLADQEILDRYNETIEARDRWTASLDYVAHEIPEGTPQVKYVARSDQWVPRGEVLRCVISDGGPDGEATVWIDNREFSLAEFGRMLTTFAGWGMRICFVLEHEVNEQPKIMLMDEAEKGDDVTVGRRSKQPWRLYCASLEPKGKRLYLADLDNRRVRVVDLVSGVVSLVAGNGDKGVPGGRGRCQNRSTRRSAGCGGGPRGQRLHLGAWRSCAAIDSASKIRTVVGASGKAGATGGGRRPIGDRQRPQAPVC